MPKASENIRKSKERKNARFESRHAVAHVPCGSAKRRAVCGKAHAETGKKPGGFADGGTKFKANSSRKILVADICASWLNSKKPYIKPSTFALYGTILENHIKPRFYHRRLTELNEIQLQGFAADLLKSLKPKTARDILTVLGQVLSYAAELGYIGIPAPKIKLPKNNAADAIRILSLPEQKCLTAYLTKGLDAQKLGVLTCLYTGIRLGEICGLRFEDLDYDNRLIKIRRTIQRISDGKGKTRFLIDAPKTRNSVRDIPMPNFLFDILKRCKSADADAYFLTGTREFTQPRTYQNRFKAYLRECALPDFSFHSLRHTFASRAVELGFDPKTLSEILGHANVNITLNRYVHSSTELKRRNMNRLSPAT